MLMHTIQQQTEPVIACCCLYPELADTPVLQSVYIMLWQIYKLQLAECVVQKWQ